MRRHNWDPRRHKGADVPPAAAQPETEEPSAFAPVPVPAPEPEGDAAGPSLVRDVEIPELRRKEKEKKGVGGFWSGASPGPGSALARAATGGYTSPFGLGKLAAALAQRIGAQTVIGQLLLGRAGGWALLSGIVGCGILVGLFAGALAKRPTKPAGGAALALSLEGPRSAVRVNGPRGKSLDYLQNANEGELSFGEARPKPPKEEEADGAAAQPAAEEAAGAGGGEAPAALPEGVADAVGAQAAAEMARYGKLASMQGALGRDSFMGGGAGAQGAMARALKVSLSAKDGQLGKSSKLTKGRGKMAATNLSRTAGRTSKAMGQLRLARFMSGTALNQGKEEGSAQFASNAFEQSKTQGGDLPAFIGPSNGAPQVVVPPGSGAPDVTSLPTPPSVGPEVNATPYQPTLDAAKGMGDTAGMMKIMSLLMIAAGIALCASGNPWAIAAGIALIAAGVIMAAMAQNMAAQAKALANNAINGQYEQKDQAQITSETAQAKADNRPYTPPNLSNKTKNNEELHQKIEDERNATYDFGDGKKSQ